MKDPAGTDKELVEEISLLKQRIQELEHSESELKRVQEVLRKSEEKYSQLSENANDAILSMDLDGIIQYVNRTASDLARPLDLIGLSMRDITSANFLQNIPELLRKRREGDDSTFAFEWDITTPDSGRHFIMDVRSSLLTENGEPSGVLIIARDVTDRKQAEGELLKTSERLELAMDAGEHGFWDWNLDTNDVYFSPSYYTMLGYEPGELPMKLETWINLMHPDDRKTIVPKVESCVKNAKTYEVEFRLKTKDGDWKWILGKGKSFKKDIDGIPHRALGVHIDITDRKKSEEDLKETLENLRKSFGVTIQVMVSAVEVRDPYTAGHQLRSADLARAIATEMVLSQDRIEGIRMAGSIHDIGKISIPAELLSKPTKLTNIEFSLIKEHAQKGYEILKDVESPWPLAEIVYQHHERIDGSGYPRNLKGNDILMEARIMAVADVVEAMASHRPYRPTRGIDMALEEIEKNKGTLYDNTVVDACLRLFRGKGFQLKGT